MRRQTLILKMREYFLSVSSLATKPVSWTVSCQEAKQLMCVRRSAPTFDLRRRNNTEKHVSVCVSYRENRRQLAGGRGQKVVGGARRLWVGPGGRGRGQNDATPVAKYGSVPPLTETKMAACWSGALTWGMPSQSSASCMASVAFSTGFTGSQVSQSGHRPAGGPEEQGQTGTGCWSGGVWAGSTSRTWGTAVHQSSQSSAVAPVPAEVGDGKIGDFVLDPAQETLFRRL